MYYSSGWGMFLNGETNLFIQRLVQKKWFDLTQPLTTVRFASRFFIIQSHIHVENPFRPYWLYSTWYWYHLTFQEMITRTTGSMPQETS